MTHTRPGDSIDDAMCPPAKEKCRAGQITGRRQGPDKEQPLDNEMSLYERAGKLSSPFVVVD